MSKKKTDAEMFPDGMNNTFWLFKKALTEIMESEEIDHIIKNAKLYERRKLLNIKKMYKSCKSYWANMETYPVWGLILMIDSADLWQDILIYMAECDTNVHRFDGENANGADK